MGGFRTSPEKIYTVPHKIKGLSDRNLWLCCYT
jgi:hypothetical protein